jgi:hypothetical protein
MNFDSLKSSIGTRIKFRPAARSCNADGALDNCDDEWLLERVDRAFGIRLRNLRTSHVAKLNSDHVHHFASAPHLPDQVKRGFLELTVSVELRGDDVVIEPILSGPGRLSYSSNAGGGGNLVDGRARFLASILKATIKVHESSDLRKVWRESLVAIMANHTNFGAGP